jgi:dCMP deaminase
MQPDLKMWGGSVTSPEAQKWNNRFISLAEHIAGWSKDPARKVGAVIIDNKRRILASGYNGFPRGVPDFEELYRDKPMKHPRVVHAELNAILNAKTDLEGSTLYVTHSPCCECAKAIIQAGISKVYIKEQEKPSESWQRSVEVAHEMFRHAKIDVYIIKVNDQLHQG